MLTIGCDPELLLVTPSNIVTRADNHISNGNSNAIFGVDGSGGPAEIRVSPSRCPSEAVAKIMDVMINHAPDSIRRYKWRAGACFHDNPIGGHIHLAPLNNKTFNVKILITTLNTIFEDVRRHIEPQSEVATRIDHGYGSFENDECFRGGHGPNGIEYRPLLSWLVNPKIAFAYLSTAYAISMATLVDEGLTKKVNHIYDLFFLRKRFGFSPEVNKGVLIMMQLYKAKIHWAGDIRRAWGVR